MPVFKGYGGSWFDGKTPVFDSEAAVKATDTYLKLFKYSAPGSQTGGWDEAVGAFTSGQVAMLIESTPLVGMAIDRERGQRRGPRAAAVRRQNEPGERLGERIKIVVG